MATLLYTEESVNTHKPNQQEEAQIAVLSGGGYVVVWASNDQDGSQNGVYAQRFTASGVPIGPELRINTATEGIQDYPHVAALSSGGFVVTWQDNSGVDGSGYGILAQRYDANGQAQGSNFVVNTTTDNSQYHDAVAGYTGGFAVVYAAAGVTGGNGLDIYVKRYDNAGVQTLAETRVSNIGATTNPQTSTQQLPDVAAHANGNLVVVWEDHGGSDGSSYGVFARTISAAGVQSSTIQVNATATGNQYEPVVATLAGGGFVVVWRSDSQDGSSAGVYAQRFNAAGAKVGSEFLVNESTTGGQYQPDVTGLSTGGFVVTWHNDNYDVTGTGTASDVYVREYDASGTALIGQRKLASPSNSTEDQPTVADLGSGNYVVAYRDYNNAAGGSNTYDIVQQVFGTAAQLPRQANPTLGDFIGTVTFGENLVNATPQVIDAAVSLADSDSANFAGGRVDLFYTVTGDASDQLGVRNQGTGFNQIGVAGSTVSYAGTAIGTLSGGSNGANLTISLNASATVAAVEALIENLTYASTSQSPAASREVGIRVSDGDGGASTSTTVTIQVTNELDGAPLAYGETLVNTHTTNTQEEAQIAVLADGSYVVVWNSQAQDGSQSGVYAQRFTASGVAQGPEWRINTATEGIQDYPHVAALSSGGFVVTWQDNSGVDGSGYGILAQRYDAAGLAQGSNFVVNTTTNNSQYHDAVAGYTGGFAVVYAAAGVTGGSGFDIYVKRYDNNGVQTLTETRVSNIGATANPQTSTQQLPDVAAHANGNLVVVWEDHGGNDGSSYGVFARTISAAGVQSSTIQVNATATGNQYEPVVATLADGGFVVVWRSDGQDGSSAGVYAQRFNAAGAKVGGEFLVNESTTGGQYQPDVTGLSTGGFVVTWYNDNYDVSGTGTTTDTYIREYDASGVALDGQRKLASASNSTEYQPTVADLGSGNYVVAYTDYNNGADGNNTYEIVQQIFGSTAEMPRQASPTLGDFVGTVTFAENLVNTTPQVIDAAVSLADSDSANFAGGRVDLFYTVTGDAFDQLGVRNQGTGAGQIGVSGSNVSYGGTVIGTLSGGSNGASLTISLNASATVQAVETLIENLTYASTSQSPTATRTVGIRVSDGDGGSSAATTVDITVTGEQDGATSVHGEEAVNTYTQSTQETPEIAVLNNGSYVITWTSQGQDGSGTGVYAQRFASNGVAVGGEFRVNTQTTNSQEYAHLSKLSDGGFVVVWQDSNGADGSGWGVYAQRYNAAGVAQGANSLVNTVTSGTQYNGAVASYTGGFAVAYSSSGPAGGSGQDVYFKRFDNAGNEVAGETRVSNIDATGNAQTSTQLAPSIMARADGSLVVTWEDHGGNDGSGYGVFLRTISAAGVQSATVQVNSFTSGNQYEPNVALLSGGGFVVVWRSDNQDGSSAGVYAQLFNAAGAKVGGEFLVNESTTGGQYQPQVTGLSTGGFVVTWYNDNYDVSGTGTTTDSYIREFTSSGVAVDGQRKLLSASNSTEYQPTVADLGSGNFVVAYTDWDNGPGGNNSYEIRQQIFGTASELARANANPLIEDLRSTRTLSSSNASALWVGNAQIIDGDVKVRDADSANFDGGQLSVSLLDGVTATEALGVRNEGNGAGQIGVSGSNVSFGGVVIGTLSGGGAGAGALTVTLNASANAAGVQALIQNITYQNTSAAPVDRSVGFRLTDGDSGQSLPLDVRVDIVVTATPPVVDVDDIRSSIVLTETQAADGVLIDDAVQVEYNGAGSFANGVLLVSYLSSTSRPADQLAIAATGTGAGQVSVAGNAVSYQGTAIGTISATLTGSNGANLQITFNASATAQGIERVIEHLEYSNTSPGPNASRSLRIELTDSNGVTSTDRDLNITIGTESAAGAAVPLFGETQSNTYEAGQQQTPAIARLQGSNNGGYVITWVSEGGQDGEGYGIFAQRYTANGAAVGPEFQVNSFTLANQYEPAAGGLANGGFVIAWRDDSNRDESSSAVWAQRYNADGSAAGGEFMVNTTTLSYQYAPAVLGLADGSFIVAYASYYNGNAGNYDVLAQRYSAAGAPLGTELTLNTLVTGEQNQPELAALSTTGFVATWTDTSGSDGSGYSVRAQRYANDGSKVGSEIAVNATAAGNQQGSDVAALSGGRFVVTWHQGGSAVHAQVFNADGSKSGAEIVVNDATDHPANYDSYARVAALETGGFVVAWDGSPSNAAGGSGIDTMVQQFDASGNRVDGVQIANSTKSSTQYQPDIAGLAGNTYVVGWAGYDSESTTANTYGVFHQLFGTAGALTRSAAPSLADLASTVTFAENTVNATPQVIDAGVSLTDSDSANFDGGRLWVSVLSGYGDIDYAQLPSAANTQDQLGVRNQGSGAGQVGVAGSTVSYGGVAIGTIQSNGSNGGDLVLSFNASATAQAVEAVIENLTYANTASNPVASRVVSVSVSDGDGATSQARTVTINVTPETDGAAPRYGNEVINTYSPDSQQSPASARLTDGGYVTVWQSNGQDGWGWGVYGQRFNGQGVPVGSEFQVNAYTPNGQEEPTVAGLVGGGFVVVWQSNGQDGSSWGVYGQRFDANGVPQGAEFRINTTTGQGQSTPVIAATADGGFVVAWHYDYYDATFTEYADIFFQRYNNAGVAQGGETRGNPAGQGTVYQNQPAIAALNGGGFVLTWTDHSQDGGSYGIYAQRFSAAGAAVGSATLVNTYTASQQYESDVAALTTGGYVIVWRSDSQDGSGAGVFAQRYDAAGSKVGSEFRVNTDTSGNEYQPTVTALAGGAFAVSWNDDNRTFVQQFNANGQPLDGALRVDTDNNSNASEPEILGLAGGGFVVSWSDYDASGGTYQVYQQLFGAAGSFPRQANPQLVDVATSVTFAENTINATPQVIDAGVGLVDADSANFDGGILEVNYLTDYGAQDQLGLQGLGAQDQLGIRNQGNAQGQVGVSGTEVRYGGTVIGTVLSNGANGSKLTVQFNTSATADAVEHVIENLTYGNTSSNPIASRTVSIRVSDGDGGASEARQVQINVTPQVDGAVKIGQELVVNTTVAAQQVTPSVAELADGGYVVTWTDHSGADGNVYGVYAQRYDAGDNAVGSEFRVNSTTTSYQYEPQVASLQGGGFVIVWRSDNQDGSSAGVYGQRYNADGSAAGGEFRVNTTTAQGQYQPTVTGTSDGGFVVAWYYDYYNASFTELGDVFFQRYNSAGVAQGGETRGNPAGQGTTYQSAPEIAALAGGRFVLTWTDNSQDGSSYGVFGQVFNANGTASGAAFQVNSYTATEQYENDVAALQDGGFVVVWRSDGQDLSGTGVYAQRYSAAGAAVGTEFRVNTTISSNQYQPQVTGLENGGFAVTWYSDHTGDVYVQQYDAAGRQVDGETRVNNYTPATQHSPAITGMSDGGFVVAYEGYRYSGDGDGNGLPDGGNDTDEIRLQRFSNEAPDITDVSVSGTEEQVITLTAALFESGYEDPQGQSLQSVRITTLPASGTLRLAGVELAPNQEVSIASLAAGELTYEGDADFFGTDEFRWTGSDGISYAATPVATHITLTNTNDGPRLQLITDGTGGEGSTFQRTITLNDPDPEGTRVTVNWGDGTAAQVYNFGNTPDHSIAHVYADNGNYQVSVTADDLQAQDNSVEQQTFSVAVANVAPTLSAIGANNVAQGEAYTLTLGAVNDPGADTETQYRISWGDGTPEQVIAAASLPANRQVTHTYATSGAMQISVTVVDEDGSFTDAGSKSLTVSAPAEVITVDAGQDVAVNEGANFSRTITFTDPTDQGTAGRSYTVAWGDGQTSTGNLGSGTTSFNINHVYADGSNDYDVTVTVTDDAGQQGVDSFSVDVNNVAPTVSISGAGSVNEGGTYTATLTRSDPGADTLAQYVIHWGDGSSQTVAAADVPSNGQFTHVYADDENGPVNTSTRTITVDVVDEDGTWLAAGTRALSVLNVAPTATVTGAATAAEGSAFALNVGAITEPGADTRTGYSINWGDGSVQSFTVAEWTSAAGSFSHVYADGQSGGTARTVTVSATDEDGTFTLGSHALTVTNAAPTLALTGADSLNEGSSYALAVAASDPAGANDTLSYSIDWGDGSAVQTLTAAELTALSGSVAHVFTDDQDGPVNATARTISVTANDGEGGSTTQNKSVTVNNVAPSIALSGAASAQVGQSYTLNLGAVIDPGLDTVSQYRIDWGDGSAVQTVAAAGNVDHTYATTGARTISVALVDEDGTFTNPATMAVNVSAATPTVSLDAGADTALDEGSTFTRTVNFGDGQDNGAAGWSYSINYGDGSAAVTGTTLTQSLALSHLYADGNASRTVSVTVTDVAGESATDSFVVTVANVAPTATVSGATTVNEGSAYTLSVTDLADPGADTRTAYSIDWGDGTVQNFTPAQWAQAAGSFARTYADGGDGGTSRTVTVRTTDEDGSHVLGTQALLVSNVAPTLAVGGAASLNEGQSYVLDIVGGDAAGTSDALTYSIDWGDGSAVQNLTAAQLATLAGKVAHVFADDENGPVNATARTITVTVNDGDGASTSQTKAVTVNNVAPTIALAGAATGQAGQTYTLTLGAITDPGTDTVAEYQIDWGDGTAVQTVNAAGPVTHVFGSAGTRTVSVRLVDEDGSFLNPTTVQVAVAAASSTVSIEAGDDVTLPEGTNLARSIAISDGQDNGALGWTYRIDYGDGSAVVNGTTTTPSLNLAHVYADGNAQRTVSVTVTDVTGESVTDSFVVTVENVAPRATLAGADAVDEGSPYTLLIGALLEPGADTRTAYAIDWGDGTSQNFTPAQWAQAAGSFTHTYADGAVGGTSRTVTAYATDEDGAHVLGTLDLLVHNVAPTVDLSGADTVQVNQTYTLSHGAVVDPGQDTVTGYWVDWGDGTGPQLFGATDPLTHVFTSAGTRTIAVALVDEDGGFLNPETVEVQVQAYATEAVRLGAAPDRQTGTGGQWSAAWTHSEVQVSHKANALNAGEAWSAATFNAVSAQNLAGGDVYLGDLGVSAQSAPTSSVRQELDGMEALRFALSREALGVTLNLSRLNTNDDGTGYAEAGRVRLFDAQGQLVGESVFHADNAGGVRQVTLQSDTAFSAVEVHAGVYNGADFVFGGYARSDGSFGASRVTNASGAHGSDFMVDAIELQMIVVGQPEEPVQI